MDARLDNYAGCDKCVFENSALCTWRALSFSSLLRFGWAFLANKAVWHSKGKVKAYGELFRTGDTVTVILDLDSGELHGLRLYQLGLPL